MKFFKKAMALAMCACMSISSYTFVMAQDAQESAAGVYINGKQLEGVEPVVKDNRAYVPVRSIFESLGADVEYSASAKTVTAIDGDTSVTFAVGGDEISITENGALNKITTDAPSFISGDTVYVPVRFAAEAFDCSVGWDSENSAVIIIDKDKFIADNGGSFELANQIMAFANQSADQSQKISGTINFNMSVSDGSQDISLSGDVQLNGVASATDADLACAINLNERDFEKIVDLITEGLADEDKATVEEKAAMFKNMTFDFIVDGENFIFYLKSNLFESLGLPADTWVKLDIAEIYSQMGINNVENLITQSNDMSFEDQMLLCLDMIPMDNVYEANIMIETYASMMNMFSDNAFKKTDSGYVSSTTTEIAQGSYLTMQYVVSTDTLDNITGFGIKLIASQNGTVVTSMDINATADTATIKMDMGLEGVFSFTADGTIKSEPTDETIITEPESENVLDLVDLIGMPVYSGDLGLEVSPDQSIDVTEEPAEEITEEAVEEPAAETTTDEAVEQPTEETVEEPATETTTDTTADTAA